MDKRFSHFFTFLPSRDQKAPQGNQRKGSQRTSDKILESHAPLVRTTNEFALYIQT